MSKRGYISRYMLIVKKLKAKPYISFEELISYISRQADHLAMRDDKLDIAFSKRTLQRDMKDIRDLFGVDILFSRSRKGYYISEGHMENMNFQRMMEAFELFHSLNLARDLEPFLLMEKRQPSGSEHLFGLLHAIKNRLQVNFTYQKFWEDTPSYRATAPYALKEFRYRWYLICKDLGDGRIKTFGLDRISSPEFTNITFTPQADYDVAESFLNCFGVTNPEGETPQEIILSFRAVQGRYIRSLPMHSSQEIIAEHHNKIQVKLKLLITHELVMELVSFGAEVKVLQPLSLARAVKNIHKQAAAQY